MTTLPCHDPRLASCLLPRRILLCLVAEALDKRPRVSVEVLADLLLDQEQGDVGELREPLVARLPAALQALRERHLVEHGYQDGVGMVFQLDPVGTVPAIEHGFGVLLQTVGLEPAVAPPAPPRAVYEVVATPALAAQHAAALVAVVLLGSFGAALPAATVHREALTLFRRREVVGELADFTAALERLTGLGWLESNPAPDGDHYRLPATLQHLLAALGAAFSPRPTSLLHPIGFMIHVIAHSWRKT